MSHFLFNIEVTVIGKKVSDIHMKRLSCNLHFIFHFPNISRADELAPDFKKIRVTLNHDGQVHWEPGGIFMTTCDIDIRFFPFDDQACPIMVKYQSYLSHFTGKTDLNHLTVG